VGFRYFNVYGPRQDPRGPYAAVISIWVNALLHGQALKIYGNGKQTRDFVYVGDVVEANLRAALIDTENKSAVFNIGTGVPTDLMTLATCLQQALKELRPELQFLPAQFLGARTGDIEFSYCDPRLAQYDLGFKAKVHLAEGIKETIIDLLQPVKTISI
jgi:UDP-N-acetylglucosamine 4-epimerase